MGIPWKTTRYDVSRGAFFGRTARTGLYGLGWAEISGVFFWTSERDLLKIYWK